MYTKILVPVDGSPTAESGLKEAIRLAAGQRERPQLCLLHIVHDVSMLVEMAAVQSADDTLDYLKRFGEDVLAKSAALASSEGVATVSLLRVVERGRIADLIVAEAARQGCELIAMGTHGRRGLSRLAMGSDAALVLQSSGVPVLLVRAAA